MHRQPKTTNKEEGAFNSCNDDAPNLINTSLPAEMICYIFMYCPPGLDMVLSRVCRRWRCLIQEGIFVRRSSSHKLSEDDHDHGHDSNTFFDFLRVRTWAAFHGNMKLLMWVEEDCWQQRQSEYDSDGSSLTSLPGFLKAPTDMVCCLARNMWETWNYTFASLTSGIHSQRYEDAAARFAMTLHNGRACASIRKAAIRGKDAVMLQHVFANDAPQIEDVEWAIEMDALFIFSWLFGRLKQTDLTRSDTLHQLRWFAVMYKATKVFHSLCRDPYPLVRLENTEAYVVRAIRNGDLQMTNYILELHADTDEEIEGLWRSRYVNPLRFMEGDVKALVSSMYPFRHSLPIAPQKHHKLTWLCYAAVMHLPDAIQHMTWLHQEVGAMLHTDLVAEAAMQNNVKVLMWLARKECPFDAMAPLQAARWGNAEALEALIGLGCPWHEIRCAQAARRRGYTKTLEVIRKYGALEVSDYYAKPTRMPRHIVYPGRADSPFQPATKIRVWLDEKAKEEGELEAYKVWLDQHPKLRDAAAET